MWKNGNLLGGESGSCFGWKIISHIHLKNILHIDRMKLWARLCILRGVELCQIRVLLSKSSDPMEVRQLPYKPGVILKSPYTCCTRAAAPFLCPTEATH